MKNNKQLNLDPKLQAYLTHTYNQLACMILQSQSKELILGLSGGIDSAVSLALLANWALVLNVKVSAYFLDINNSALDQQCVNFLINQYKDHNHVQITIVNLSSLQATFKASLQKIANNKLVESNLKSRLRASYLYAQANAVNGIVISSLNYDEYLLGFFCKFGDNAADFHLLIGLLKTHVYSLANYYNIPELITTRAPSPSNTNDPNEADEIQLDFTYKELDAYLLNAIGSEKLIKKIKERIKNNKHKHFALQDVYWMCDYLKKNKGCEANEKNSIFKKTNP